VYKFLNEYLESNKPELKIQLIKGVPSRLNAKFLRGFLDTTPISSIEYARHSEKCYILPDISISSDGKVRSIFLFSKKPVAELGGRTIALTSASATSTVLLKILLKHCYNVDVKYVSMNFNQHTDLSNMDAFLLIGDEAMWAYYKGVDEFDHIFDLGELWKEFTGEKMVYALWVVRKDFADKNADVVDVLSKALLYSKIKGLKNLDLVIKDADQRLALPKTHLKKYIKSLNYNFDDKYQESLILFYEYAHKSGFIGNEVKLNIWRGKCAD